MQSSRFVLPFLLLSTLATQFALLTREPAAEAVDTDRDVAAALSRTVEEVSAEVAPAVVSVTSLSGQRTRARGSGVIIRSDGVVVTNYHVIQGGNAVTVTLQDGSEVPARVRGFDSETDLAILDIRGRGFPVVQLSEEGPPPIGTWVLALGNPMGLDHTVTFGIISARGRSINIATYEDFIQTDAAINAGNSGGPLVNLDGEVVGINTAKEVVLTGSQGLGFAIPAYMVREVVDEILEKGFVERGWFGISVADLPTKRADSLGAASTAYVRQVIPDSPAAAAGFEDGDIVLSIGGMVVTESKDVLDQIAKLDPGTKTAVDVWRDHREKLLLVEVGKRVPLPPTSRR